MCVCEPATFLISTFQHKVVFHLFSRPFRSAVVSGLLHRTGSLSSRWPRVAMETPAAPQVHSVHTTGRSHQYHISDLVSWRYSIYCDLFYDVQTMPSMVTFVTASGIRRHAFTTFTTVWRYQWINLRLYNAITGSIYDSVGIRRYEFITSLYC